MFGVNELKEDVKCQASRIKDCLDLIDKHYQRSTAQNEAVCSHVRAIEDRFIKRFDELNAKIEKVTSQVRQLATISNCRITPPQQADPGGIVVKMTEKEIEDRKNMESLFVSPFLYGVTRPLPESMPKKKKKKNVSKRTKK